jgi:hypothetical protein
VNDPIEAMARLADPSLWQLVDWAGRNEHVRVDVEKSLRKAKALWKLALDQLHTQDCNSDVSVFLAAAERDILKD